MFSNLKMCEFYPRGGVINIFKKILLRTTIIRKKHGTVNYAVCLIHDKNIPDKDMSDKSISDIEIPDRHI